MTAANSLRWSQAFFVRRFNRLYQLLRQRNINDGGCGRSVNFNLRELCWGLAQTLLYQVGGYQLKGNFDQALAINPRMAGRAISWDSVNLSAGVRKPLHWDCWGAGDTSRLAGIPIKAMGNIRLTGWDFVSTTTKRVSGEFAPDDGISSDCSSFITGQIVTHQIQWQRQFGLVILQLGSLIAVQST